MEINAFGGYGVGGISGGYSASQASRAATVQFPTTAAAQQNVAAEGTSTPSALAQPSSIAQEKAFANVMNDKFNQECQTCKNRKYQDGSNDSGVSFQTPQHINPAISGAVVASHEQEHVSRNQAKADSEGNEVVSQTVQLHGAICPECGRNYIAGGTTTTTVKSGGEKNAADRRALDIVA